MVLLYSSDDASKVILLLAGWEKRAHASANSGQMETRRGETYRQIRKQEESQKYIKED